MTGDQKRTSATRSSGSFRGIYVSKGMMDAVFPGAYELLPEACRDRIPTLGRASAAHSMVLRSGLTVLLRFVDDLMKRLQHTDGEEWELWKLLVACYCIEREVGPNALRGAGQKLFSLTKSEPKTVGEAVRGLQASFQEQHGGMSVSLIGGWRIHHDGASEIAIDDATYYPCALHEGLIVSICDAYAKSGARHALLEEPLPKRQGGAFTRYVIRFNA